MLSFALSASTVLAKSKLCEAGVQTGFPFDCKDWTQRCSAPGWKILSCPQVPQNTSVWERSFGTQTCVETNQAGNSQLSRLPPKPHCTTRRVTLNTRTRAMKEFQETPNVSISQLLLKIACMMNPRGKGCCFYHVSLLVLQRNVSELLTKVCVQTLRPNHEWQCPQCLAMLADDVEDYPMRGHLWAPSFASCGFGTQRTPTETMGGKPRKPKDPMGGVAALGYPWAHAGGGIFLKQVGGPMIVVDCCQRCQNKKKT